MAFGFIIVLILCIALFGLTKTIQSDNAMRIILIILSALCIAFIQFKDIIKSDFVTIFISVSIVYLISDPILSIITSYIYNEKKLFSKMGVLSKTEGFIFFTCTIYIIYNIIKKKKCIDK